MFCKHNYVYTQGHFYCTKCHHRTHKEKYGKRKGSKKAIVVSGVVIAGIIGIMFVNGILQINQENLNESIKNLPASLNTSISNLPQSLDESIQDIQKNLPIDIPKIPTVAQSKSALIGKSTILDEVEFTVVDVFYSDIGHAPLKTGSTTETRASKYTTFLIVEMKVENLGGGAKSYGLNVGAVYDQRLNAYAGFARYWSPLQPNVPQVMMLYFEVPKDDSLVFSLHLPIKAKHGSPLVNLGQI